MFEISVETYEKNCIHTKTVHKKVNKSVLCIKIHDIQDKLGAKNMSDLTIKEIKGIYNTKTPTYKPIRRYKRYGKELIADLAEIYIHEDLALSIIKRLLKLEFKSNHLIKSKFLKLIVKKILPSLENMQMYCLGCKKHSNNIGSKKVTMTNKVIRDKSICANCMADKSRFLKQKFNKKSRGNNINPKLFVH